MLSTEYESFRSSVPQRKVLINEDGNKKGANETKEWVFYDAGPRAVRHPMVFLPPVSGQADVYFKQILSLSARGYRVLAIDYPAYWSVPAFCENFSRFLEALNLQKVHLFGSSLGGFLAQAYAEFVYGTQRVLSLVLCNTFVDTKIFDREDSSNLYWLMPPIVLKRLVLGGFPQGLLDKEIAESIDFMVESLERLTQSQLASRLTLNCSKCRVHAERVAHLPVTIIDVYDECALSPEAREELQQTYASAKRASLKTGGNFPYLSRSAEVNTHLMIHLRQFNMTAFSAREDSGCADEAEGTSSADVPLAEPTGNAQALG